MRLGCERRSAGWRGGACCDWPTAGGHGRLPVMIGCGATSGLLYFLTRRRVARRGGAARRSTAGSRRSAAAGPASRAERPSLGAQPGRGAVAGPRRAGSGRGRDEERGQSRHHAGTPRNASQSYDWFQRADGQAPRGGWGRHGAAALQADRFVRVELVEGRSDSRGEEGRSRSTRSSTLR